MRYFIFNIIVPDFSCEKLLLNITHDRKGIPKFHWTISSDNFIVLYNHYNVTFISLLKKIAYWPKLGKFLWTNVLLNIPRANFSYGFIDLPILEFFFRKMKSFSVKGFYLKLIKKVASVSIR